MPVKLWIHTCCGCADRYRYCSSCRRRAKHKGWRLTRLEQMARFQLSTGLKPMGPHWTMVKQLSKAVRCPDCDGVGLLDSPDGEHPFACAKCFGFGTLPPPWEPEVAMLRRRVGEVYPDALAEWDPFTVAEDLLRLLSHESTPIHHLGSNTMIISPPAPAGRKPGGRPC